ncbi:MULTISPECIES: response regulator transcription factor [unclassified Bacillus (in: firmicutes)]|uniref:response regulator transcription factor n=1 Tax=unclassified Bacillus (in: firmicutes) TaxID=185979 RepID=UPI0008F20A86|nr:MULTISPECIES: response regulator transcription factor [unclassified Bacillus (in: firmicutes)]SFB12003.1 DNA-binding response regulator, OmpR family, contains REC and winged-helix (wHTH) domain [Bacillus sp. UNCCL13]SFQ90363.1 DNA-binding response regulator, OmpR family, contains REC and winged-helix (wHTH) domain [Bacillus sp. cl95]
MKKILVIEDEKSIAELERDYLEINGFTVEICLSGSLGLELALTKDYDLILLDLMLPHVDGYEICRQIRREKDIPIIIVSAKKEDIDKIRGLGLGADDYMVKPFSPNELVARVKAHLSRFDRLAGKQTRKVDELYIRGLYIDRTSRRVFINNKEVILTAKEFELLAFLASNPNQVFSKDHLFEKLWGLDSLGDITTVTVHIRKIREKVESDPSNPQYIETVWGAGYRFKGEN